MPWRIIDTKVHVMMALYQGGVARSAVNWSQQIFHFYTTQSLGGGNSWGIFLRGEFLGENFREEISGGNCGVNSGSLSYFRLLVSILRCFSLYIKRKYY